MYADIDDFGPVLGRISPDVMHHSSRPSKLPS